jgi:ribosome-associated toxin RatA of RatAB toxin-antitoxin module
MPTISRSALVMFSCQQMYQLVNDVAAYPEFLTDCKASKIIAQTDTSMTASLLVAKAGIQKWFTTENTLIENQQIILTLVDGPFKKLSGCWQFEPLSEQACKVSLTLDYEFSNQLIAAAFGSIFSSLANSLVQQFSQRAKEVYQAHV